jgi:hypothetical protein
MFKNAGSGGFINDNYKIQKQFNACTIDIDTLYTFPSSNKPSKSLPFSL